MNKQGTQIASKYWMGNPLGNRNDRKGLIASAVSNGKRDKTYRLPLNV